MWLCLNDGFISVVQDKNDANLLMVRARRKAHLKRLLGRKTRIHETPQADYRWRALVGRKRMVGIITNRILSLDYTNFKDSVKDEDLHHMYLGWWFDHHRFQQQAGQQPMFDDIPYEEIAQAQPQRLIPGRRLLGED
jgi:hypothetical protein